MFSALINGMVDGFQAWLIASFVIFMVDKWIALEVSTGEVESVGSDDAIAVDESIEDLLEEIVEVDDSPHVVYMAAEVETFQTIIKVEDQQDEKKYSLNELRKIAVGSGIKNYKKLKKEVLYAELMRIGRI